MPFQQRQAWQGPGRALDAYAQAMRDLLEANAKDRRRAIKPTAKARPGRPGDEAVKPPAKWGPRADWTNVQDVAIIDYQRWRRGDAAARAVALDRAYGKAVLGKSDAELLMMGLGRDLNDVRAELMQQIRELRAPVVEVVDVEPQKRFVEEPPKRFSTAVLRPLLPVASSAASMRITRGDGVEETLETPPLEVADDDSDVDFT